MKLQKIIMAMAGLTIPALAAQYSMELDAANTKLEWILKDPLHTVHGTFLLKSGRIDFDPDTGAASGRIVVDVTSGNSGNSSRDHRMHENVLESAKFPEAVFVPDRIEGRLQIPGESDVKLHGTFTIHGAAHEMTMDVQEQSTAGSMRTAIHLEIPYVAWGMKDPSNFLLHVDKSVSLSLQTNAALLKH